MLILASSYNLTWAKSCPILLFNIIYFFFCRYIKGWVFIHPNLNVGPAPILILFYFIYIGIIWQEECVSVRSHGNASKARRLTLAQKGVDEGSRSNPSGHCQIKPAHATNKDCDILMGFNPTRLKPGCASVWHDWNHSPIQDCVWFDATENQDVFNCTVHVWLRVTETIVQSRMC